MYNVFDGWRDFKLYLADNIFSVRSAVVALKWRLWPEFHWEVNLNNFNLIQKLIIRQSPTEIHVIIKTTLLVVKIDMFALIKISSWTIHMILKLNKEGLWLHHDKYYQGQQQRIWLEEHLFHKHSVYIQEMEIFSFLTCNSVQSSPISTGFLGIRMKSSTCCQILVAFPGVVIHEWQPWSRNSTETHSFSRGKTVCAGWKTVPMVMQ